MSGFAAEWLRLRAPFDAAARNRDLAARFAAALADGSGAPRRIVDLAAGSGASFMALAPLIGGDQHWLLVDSDASLLAEQAPAIASWARRQGWRCRERGTDTLVETETGAWRACPEQVDLAHCLDEVDIAGCSGVTTSAFLDLVSAAWLDRLCARLALHVLPFLAVLTVDGRREWDPSLPEDAHTHGAFARHQGRDKGFGPSLGGRAASYLATGLAAQGYRLSTARSDWRIGAEHPAMLLRLAQEEAAVAREIEPASAAIFTEWLEARNAQIRAGALTLGVGHVDLLALPPRAPSQEAEV